MEPEKLEDSPYDMAEPTPTIESAYAPRERNFRGLLYALYLAYVPHRMNSQTRKWITVVLTITWGSVTVLQYFGFVSADPYSVEIYWIMTVVVMSIVSHVWGFEYGVLSAVTVEAEARDGDDET